MNDIKTFITSLLIAMSICSGEVANFDQSLATNFSTHLFDPQSPGFQRLIFDPLYCK